MKHSNFINKLFIYAVLGTFVFSACSNSTSSNDEEEHADAEGFVLTMNGADIVTQLPDSTISGEIELEPGEETDLISIYFFDDDGDRFQPDEPEFSLGFEFEKEGIAEFEQHDEDGKWSFHIHAEAVGITDLELKLMHGGHSDFTTQKIHVHVE